MMVLYDYHHIREGIVYKVSRKIYCDISDPNLPEEERRKADMARVKCLYQIFTKNLLPFNFHLQ